MAVYADREAFIPYRKSDVVELCVEDGKLQPEDAKKFREFCEIVGAYYHFDYHHELEAMKSNFAAFDPDADTKPRVVPNEEQKREMHSNLMKDFEKILVKANYRKLTDEEWKRAKEQESLITLRMDVDTNDYESFCLYHRGNTQETVELKKMFGLKKVPLTMDIFERVVLMIKFKDEAYFLQKFKGSKKKLQALNFTPGKTYIYMYKNIPQADLEIIFPNVEISMNLKDRLLFWVPAAGAGLATLVKVLPSLFIIGGILGVMFGFMQDDLLVLTPEQEKTWTDKQKQDFKDQTQKKNEKQKQLIAALSGLAVLVGFVFKQFIAYKNKRIQFLKQVADTLFFKDLVCNGGVFNSLIDAAEDEQCKQIFLAYYHLLTGGSMSKETLDDTIEGWLEQKFNTKIDFDVEQALKCLSELKGKIVEDGQDEAAVPEKAIVHCDADGKYHALPMDDAKTVVDYTWDNIFQYN